MNREGPIEGVMHRVVPGIRVEDSANHVVVDGVSAKPVRLAGILHLDVLYSPSQALIALTVHHDRHPIHLRDGSTVRTGALRAMVIALSRRASVGAEVTLNHYVPCEEPHLGPELKFMATKDLCDPQMFILKRWGEADSPAVCAA